MTIKYPKLYIIILNWNGGKYLLSCLNSLRKVKSKIARLEFLIVDNNSTDASVKNVIKKFPNIKIIKNLKNLGYSGGNNVGIKYALKQGADYILLLNPDTQVDNKFIDPLLESLEKNKKNGIAGPKTYKKSLSSKLISNAGNFLDRYLNGKDLGNGKLDKGQYDSVFLTDYVSGTAMLIKKIVFKKIGYFDERFFLYYEDVDFCLRAKVKGFESCFVQKSLIFHKGSVNTVVGSPLHTYYNTRNRLLFLKKYSSLIPKIFEVIKLMKIVLRFIIKRRKNDKYVLLAIGDYLLGRFGERVYW